MKETTKPTCEMCGRRLTDPQSVTLGFGPDCAEARQNLLSGAGITEAELTSWRAVPAAKRWVDLAFMAVRKGHLKDAQRFFEAAQRALPNQPQTLLTVAPTPVGLGQPAQATQPTQAVSSLAPVAARVLPAPQLSLAGFEQAAERRLGSHAATESAHRKSFGASSNA